MREMLMNPHRWQKLLISASICILPATAIAQNPVELSGEMRSRAEGRENADFNSDRLDGALFVLNRMRLDISRDLHEDIRLLVQIQDSRIWGEEGGSLASLSNFDLHQGYFQVDHIANLPLRIRIGRQELAFGSGRLMGAYDWHNIGRAFDAATISLGDSLQQVNLWVAQVRDQNAPKIARNQEFAGVYYSNRKRLPDLIEGYALLFYDWRNFDSLSDLDVPVKKSEKGTNHLALWTIGTRFQSSKTRSFVVEAEGAYQIGDRGPEDIRAFALAFRGDLKLDAKYSPTLGVGYTYGSGDDDRKDLRVETFTSLFPDVHNHLGDLDYASWSNISAYEASLEMHPAKSLSFKAQILHLRIATDNDAWYRAGGYLVGSPAEIYRTAVPGAGKTVGNEIDLGLTFLYRDQLSIRAGLSAFFVGEFIDNTGGLRADDSYWGFLETSIRF